MTECLEQKSTKKYHIWYIRHYAKKNVLGILPLINLDTIVLFFQNDIVKDC